jgi:hypothetical protein
MRWGAAGSEIGLAGDGSELQVWSGEARPSDSERGEICYYGDPHVRLRRFEGVGEGLADIEKQGIGHLLKRTRTLYYLVTSLIKTMDTHVVYIRYLSPSSRRSFLLLSSCANFSGMQQLFSSSLQQPLAQTP